MGSLLAFPWVKEHCRRNPLHSSTGPEKGTGLAMGLVETDGEEVVVEVTEVTGVVVVVRIRQRESTISWNRYVQW